MKIGAKINVFNANLIETRKRLGISQIELADSVGVEVDVIRSIETLKQPRVRFEKLKGILYKISDILGAEFTLLFPDDYLLALQNKFFKKPRNFVVLRDINILSLPVNDQELMLPSPEEIVGEEMDDNFRKRNLYQAIDELQESSTNKNILKYLYGLNDVKGHTIKETGQKFCVTPEKVRQIEAKVINKLRKPKTIRLLKGGEK
jgi:transcriptional regulator with XRE-family HTH domain